VAYGGVGLTAANWPNFIRDNYRHRIASGASRAKAGALLAYGSVVGALFNLIEATAPIA
jgi:hypothetical protein